MLYTDQLIMNFIVSTSSSLLLKLGLSLCVFIASDILRRTPFDCLSMNVNVNWHCLCVGFFYPIPLDG